MSREAKIIIKKKKAANPYKSLQNESRRLRQYGFEESLFQADCSQIRMKSPGEMVILTGEEKSTQNSQLTALNTNKNSNYNVVFSPDIIKPGFFNFETSAFGFENDRSTAEPRAKSKKQMQRETFARIIHNLSSSN